MVVGMLIMMSEKGLGEVSKTASMHVHWSMMRVNVNSLITFAAFLFYILTLKVPRLLDVVRLLSVTFPPVVVFEVG